MWPIQNLGSGPLVPLICIVGKIRTFQTKSGLFADHFATLIIFWTKSGIPDLSVALGLEGPPAIGIWNMMSAGPGLGSWPGHMVGPVLATPTFRQPSPKYYPPAWSSAYWRTIRKPDLQANAGVWYRNLCTGESIFLDDELTLEVFGCRCFWSIYFPVEWWLTYMT